MKIVIKKDLEYLITKKKNFFIVNKELLKTNIDICFLKIKVFTFYKYI